MTSQNVADCVAAQGDAYAGYGPAFVAQKIDGKFLMSVENDDIEPTLTKVGVTNPHHVAALRTLLLSVRSVALIEATLPPTAEGEEGIEQLEVLMRTANTLFQQEKLEDARALYEKALEGFERLVGPEHPSTVSVVNNLGTLLYTQQKLGDAQQMYERALVGRERVLGPQHVRTLNTCQHLGTLALLQDKKVPALNYFTRCLEGYQIIHGAEHRDTMTSRKHAEALAKDVFGAGNQYRMQNNTREAEVCFNMARKAHTLTEPPSDPKGVVRALRALAVIYEQQGRYDEALQVLTEVLDRLTAAHGADTEQCLGALTALGELHRNQGLVEEARGYYTRAAVGWERLRGPDHADTRNARKELSKLGPSAAATAAEAAPQLEVAAP